MLSRLKAARTATLDLFLAPTPWHLSAITRSRKRNSSTSDSVTFTGRVRQMLISRCSVWALAAAWLLALLTPAFAQSGEHGDGHLQMHDIYRHWHPPLNPNTSCCNDADCFCRLSRTVAGVEWQRMADRAAGAGAPDRLRGRWPLSPLREGGLCILLHARRDSRLITSACPIALSLLPTRSAAGKEHGRHSSQAAM